MTRFAQAPLDTYQACEILGRSDSRGHEEGEKPFRPWLVLSDKDIHEQDFFIGCSITTAGERSERVYLLENPFPEFDPPLDTPGPIDLQQIWSFSFEQDYTRHPVKCLRTSEVPRILGRLEERFVPNKAPEAPCHWSTPVVGRVIWVELLPRAGEDLPRARKKLARAREKLARAREKLSDLDLLRDKLTKMGVPWQLGKRHIMCVIVASSLAEWKEGYKAFGLVTVVPLIEAPEFQDNNEDNPKVRVEISGETVYYSALTQLLLTVDHGKSPKYRGANGQAIKQDKRVFFHDGPLKSWIVEPAEIDDILRYVRLSIGIPS